MADIRRTQPDFLNGIPELLILQLLARRPMYGYELVQTIKNATQAQLEFGEGCVYPILHRLEREGLLASRQQEVNGRGRIVYRVTARGQKQLAASASVWQGVVRAVNLVLEGGPDARPSVV